MTLSIELTPTEEAQLSAAAEQIGLAPAELARKLVKEHLSAIPTTEDDLDAKLRRWQVQDGVNLLPDIPTETLLAEWAEEDAQMTDEQREAEDRLWLELEKDLTETGRRLGLRGVSAW